MATRYRPCPNAETTGCTGSLLLRESEDGDQWMTCHQCGTELEVRRSRPRLRIPPRGYIEHPQETGPKPETVERAKEAARLRRMGIPLEEIETALGVSRRSAHRLLRMAAEGVV